MDNDDIDVALLASRTGIKKSTLTTGLQGRTAFEFVELQVIADALGIPVTDLLPSDRALADAAIVATIDEADREFEEWMADNLPMVKRGTAAWRIAELENEYRVECNSGRFTPIEDIGTPPEWSYDYTISEKAVRPAFKTFNSPAVSVPMSMHNARRCGDDALDMARVAVLLKQYVFASDPHVQLAFWMYEDDDDDWNIKIRGLTLSEATQLAHTLLLMVDVAHEAEQRAAQGADS